VHAFGVLDQPEYEISFVERERTDLPTVIASQLLLIERCSGQGLLSCLLEEVDVVFTSLFRFLLRVLDRSWHIEFDVGGQHSLCPEDQEEGSEADRTVWSGAQAPEH
jgi:hypothetical protein